MFFMDGEGNRHADLLAAPEALATRIRTDFHGSFFLCLCTDETGTHGYVAGLITMSV